MHRNAKSYPLNMVENIEYSSLYILKITSMRRGIISEPRVCKDHPLAVLRRRMSF